MNIAKKAKLGYCPKCGAPGKIRERRANGNDICANGHSYPSANASPVPFLPNPYPIGRTAELLLWAFAHGAKWEPPGFEYAEFVFNSIRYIARLDAAGLPVPTPGMLDDIAAARAKRTGGGY